MKYLGPKTDGDDLATQSDLSGGGGASTPAGVIVPFAGSSAPTGYLVCDGAAVSRTTYADLFAAIGTTYGAGDGSTTFALPNLKGRVVVGVDAGQSEFDTLGETGGAKTHTLDSTEIPSHTHSDGTLTTNETGDHSHSDGTLATDTAASHTHSDGTLATDTEGDHTHGTGTLATVANGSHSHSSVLDGTVRPVLTAASLSFSTLNSVRNDGNQSGVVRNLSLSTTQSAAAQTSTTGSHSHTLSGSTGDGGSHSHDVTGSTGSGGSHSHDVTGSTGSAGSHAHDVSGSTGSTGGGGSHNNLSPYMALSYLIKT